MHKELEIKDNYYYYFCLHAYLTKADTHYIEGRLLWLNSALDGACNLLWLSIEQMIKLLIIQTRLDNRTLGNIEIKEDQNKITYFYDPQETDKRKIYKILDRTSYEINSKHQLGNLLQILKEETGIHLEKFYTTPDKVKECFDKRYYKDQSSSINCRQIEEIDNIYFTLRGKINENFPRALIDEISYQKNIKLYINYHTSFMHIIIINILVLENTSW